MIPSAMKLRAFVCLIASFLAASARSAELPPEILSDARQAAGWKYDELRQVPAAEARQGVAVDDEFIFVIANHAIGKYRKDSGAKVASWECPLGQPLIHLNAGIVFGGRLYCAHSNYPGVPNLSTVEIWDPATMRHVGSHSFGRTDGSLTWLARRNNRWIACFVHYLGKGGEPGRGPEWTRLVEYDDDWRESGGWVFPHELIKILGARGYSVSGGAIGPSGYLYVTGHDDPALYVLTIPEAGPVLTWVATIPITARGQGLCWDPRDPGLLYTLSRTGQSILIGRVGQSEEVPVKR